MNSNPNICEIKNLKGIFRFIFDNGKNAKQTAWNGSQPLMRLFADNFHKCITDLTKQYSDNKYTVLCRTGSSGKWCNIPYCAILSDEINKGLYGCTPSKGIFPAYLVSVDCDEIYLVYMMGTGAKSERRLIKIVNEIKESLMCDSFSTDTETLNLGKDPYKYRYATIFYKRYTADNCLTEEELEQDLYKILKIHEENGTWINRIIQDKF